MNIRLDSKTGESHIQLTSYERRCIKVALSLVTHLASHTKDDLRKHCLEAGECLDHIHAEFCSETGQLLKKGG